MKKVLAIFMAALMMFAAFGSTISAADYVEEAFTLNDALDIAKTMKDATGTVPTVLVFNTVSAKLGTTYQGQVYPITAGANKGCYALIGETFVPGNIVQLPNIKDAGDGMAANWTVLTANLDETGRTYGSGSVFVIPDMKDRAEADNYIVFYAQLTPNETTPVIAKIMGIFYRVLNVLFPGSGIAEKFLEMLAGLGLEVEI